MIITTKLSMDFCTQDERPWIQAVQDDRYSRNLELTLYDNGETWSPPDGMAVEVAYRKADGTSGWYDTMPDGTLAWSAEGNVVTVALAPQVLTAPGVVILGVVFRDGDEKQLATFPIWIRVEANPASGAAASEDYINIRQWMVDKVRETVDALIADGELVGPAGEKGESYVLTAEDTQQIAEQLMMTYYRQEILPLQTLSGFALGTKYYILTVYSATELTEGTEYAVIWDGEEYSCTCYTQASDGTNSVSGAYFLGNAAMLTGSDALNSGEPFAIACYGEKTVVYTGLSGESHTAGVYQSVSASELPAVTQEDNGKVLKVVDGVWTAAQDDTTAVYGEVILAQQTVSGFSEASGVYGVNLAQAISVAEGASCLVIWDGTEYVCQCYTHAEGGVNLDGLFLGNASVFDAEMPDTSEPFFIMMGSENSVVMTTDSGESHELGIWVESAGAYLPAVTEDDNGKVLTVVDGVWAAVEQESAQEETVIFAEQTLEFTEGVYEVSPAPFELVIGETYRVVWDGTEHACVCTEVDGVPMLTDVATDDSGNAVSGSFDMAYIAAELAEADGGVTQMVAYNSDLSMDTSASHTVAIYQGSGTAATGLPSVTADDNGKILEVIDGKWTAVAVADSSVASYVDEYINSALEGDY